MVAGISGPTPGSETAGADDDPKLKPVVSQPPKKTVSAETIARLATGRALRDLIMASPEQIPGRTVPQPSAKNQPEQCCYAIGSGLVSLSTSDIGLTKAITALLDRTAAKPYFPATLALKYHDC